MADEKLAYSVEEAAHIAGVCRADLYKAISAGELIARKRGQRTLVLRVDLQAWLEALPLFRPRQVTARS